MILSFVAILAIGSEVSATEEHADQLTQAALEQDAHPKRGAVTFSRHCASCHGVDAHGDADRVIPALAGQRFAYLLRQLANFASAERDNAAMHRVVAQKYLQDPQSWADIAAYLNGAPVLPFPQIGDGAKAALGRGIFHEQCAACHHDDARGDDDGFVPALRNQHYSYLVKEMHRLAEHHRRNVDENLVRFMRSFNGAEVDAVADYLSRLRGSVP